MDVRVVRNCLGAMVSKVPQYAAIQISMVPNAVVALIELVQIAVIHFSAEPHFVVAALRYVAGPQLVPGVHFLAFVVQTLGPVIHADVQVAPVRFVHGHA